MWVFREIEETDKVRHRCKWRGDWYECKQADEIPEGWFTLPRPGGAEVPQVKRGRPRK